MLFCNTIHDNEVAVTICLFHNGLMHTAQNLHTLMHLRQNVHIDALELWMVTIITRLNEQNYRGYTFCLRRLVTSYPLMIILKFFPL